MEVVTMKRKTLIPVAVIVVLSFVFTAGLNLFADVQDFDEELSSLTGAVSFKMPGGYFLKTDAGEEYKLGLGPVWRLEDIGLELKQDDRVTVTGFKNDDGFILVTSVKKGLKSYELAEPGDIASLNDGPGFGMGRGMMGGGMMDRYDDSFGRAGRRSDRGWGRGCW
jgi:hypothetical protein